MKNRTDFRIYQIKRGEIRFHEDPGRDTLWGSLQQIATLFGVQKSVISRHLKRIYEEGELDRDSTVSQMETEQKEGGRWVTRLMDYYSLDAIVSVGYRVNSRKAASFRNWATGTLTKHSLQGYTINRKRVRDNYAQFMRGVTNVRAALTEDDELQPKDVLALVNTFAHTWSSLEKYDKDDLPESGATRTETTFTAEELGTVLAGLKRQLIRKKQATEAFGIERKTGSTATIVDSVFQSARGEDIWPSVEEKAVHLLYSIVKDRPFRDGNKRSGAFAFVWLLRKNGILRSGITPGTLTTLTLLVANSKPREKSKVIGLILWILSRYRK